MDYLYRILRLLLLSLLAEAQGKQNSSNPTPLPVFSDGRTISFSATIGILVIIIIVLAAILVRRKLSERAAVASSCLKEGNNIQMKGMKSIPPPSEEGAGCSATARDDDSSDDSSCTSSESSDSSVDRPFNDDYVNLSRGGTGGRHADLQGAQDYVNVFLPGRSGDSTGHEEDDDAPRDTAAPVETDDSEDSEENEVNYTKIVFA